jgi:hypothetical protein
VTSCKLARSSTLQFPDSNILNHRIIVASFEEKGSHTGQAIRNDGFFFVYQCVRLVASFIFQEYGFYKRIQPLTYYFSILYSGNLMLLQSNLVFQ